MLSLMQNFYSKITIWLKHTIADNKWTIMSVKFLHPSSNSRTWRSWDPHMKCIFTRGFRNTAKVNSNLIKPLYYFASSWSWYLTHLFKAFTLHSRDAKKTHSWPVRIPIPNRTPLNIICDTWLRLKDLFPHPAESLIIMETLKCLPLGK